MDFANKFFITVKFQGDYESFVRMVLDGYDHVIDVTDADGSSIAEMARARGHPELADYLENVQKFVDVREQLLTAIRRGEIRKVQEILALPDAVKLARAKNYYGKMIKNEKN